MSVKKSFSVDQESNFIINIPKILQLSDSQKSFIMNLITMYFDSFTGGHRMDFVLGRILGSTLVRYEYLIDDREAKINDIIE